VSVVVRGTRVLDEAGMPRTLSFTVPQARATCHRPSSLNPKPQCNAALRYAYLSIGHSAASRLVGGGGCPA
jgi:hypothetical protein